MDDIANYINNLVSINDKDLFEVVSNLTHEGKLLIEKMYDFSVQTQRFRKNVEPPKLHVHDVVILKYEDSEDVEVGVVDFINNSVYDDHPMRIRTPDEYLYWSRDLSDCNESGVEIVRVLESVDYIPPGLFTGDADDFRKFGVGPIIKIRET